MITADSPWKEVCEMKPTLVFDLLSVGGLFPVQAPYAGGQQAVLGEKTRPIDFRGREAELEALENPMGLFMVARQEAMRTRQDAAAREQVKLRLIRNLRQRKMDPNDHRFWFACLDWLLRLPREREQAVRQELERLDREESMSLVSFIERQGIEKGILRTLGLYLTAKFGNEALAWLPSADQVSDEAQMAELCKRIFEARDPDADQVRALIASAVGTTPPAG
jgi:hypothetical protein